VSESRDPIEGLVETMLKELGEEPGREGLLRTPGRVARSMRFLTSGYQQDPIAILNNAVFEETYDEMVLVKDIDFYSLCEHHLLPFFGRVHVAYIPDGRIVGLSKLPRMVGMFARRPQVQERLTMQIANWLNDHLDAKGVGVVIEAEHSCMTLRGVQAAGSNTVTSALLGTLRSDPSARAEFLSLARAGS
jgi:GTP cyclohydrolase I